jgi:chromosome segregation ATPase
MDMDQILKRVQWMDDERRKDKDVIALLENRILALEGSLKSAHDQIKEQSGEIARLNTVVTRMDQYDSSLLQARLESKRQIEELDKDVKKRQEDSEKVLRVDIRAMDTSILEIKRGLEPIPRLEKGIQARLDEEARLGRAIDEVRAKVEEARHGEDEYTRTYRMLEEGRRQDSKRITDLMGEVTAMRKRVDDQRGQVELLNNSMRKLETRLNELVSVEAERRDAQTAFLDKQTLVQVERDRLWREWETRFDTVEKQAVDIEGQMQKLDTTYRDAKKSQQVLEELTAKVERRISEITEIQRLSEERFRQEWVTFKADDQKRWTNYTLIQEEQRNEVSRQSDKIFERLAQIEDSLQEEADLLQQISESSEKRLQGLLAMAHEWVTAYERSVGRAR